MLLLYAVARICQLYTDRLPTLVIVILHVIPPALFALSHGSALYRPKGMAIFVVFCLGVGTLAETVSLRTGFPFGRYYFTGLMGPKILELPVLLALAYLGIGYAAWILALLILGPARPLRGVRLFALPMLAAAVMVSWDLAMDPVWSLLDHAWVWRDGGPWFGVPVSNYLGWFLTAYLYYQSFALYCRRNPARLPAAPSRFWTPPILIYAVCALGNLLIPYQPAVPPLVTDPTGKQWLTTGILHTNVLVSLLVMLPFPVLAWMRSRHPSLAS